MPLILEEKEFMKAGTSGKIPKAVFLKSLKDVKTDDEMVSSRIVMIFNEMKTIFAGMSNGLMLQGTGNVETQRATKQAMEMVVKAISDLTKEVLKLQRIQASDVKFDVERDRFNNLVSMKARRVM